jgi:hypothetical protein
MNRREVVIVIVIVISSFGKLENTWIIGFAKLVAYWGWMCID